MERTAATLVGFLPILPRSAGQGVGGGFEKEKEELSQRSDAGIVGEARRVHCLSCSRRYLT